MPACVVLASTLTDDVGEEASLFLDFLVFPSDPCCSSDLFFFPSELPLLPPPLLVFA